MNNKFGVYSLASNVKDTKSGLRRMSSQN